MALCYDPGHELMAVTGVTVKPGGGAKHACMPDKLWHLRRLNLFDEMSDQEVEEISSEFRMWTCASGENCLGHAGDRVYLLKVGRVRLYQVTADGHELTTAVVFPGQMFGIGSLLGHSGAEQAEAMEESLICETGAQDFMAVLARHPLVMAKVVLAMARQIFQLEEALESIAYKPVPARLAELLLALLDEGEEAMGGVALPPYTQEELGKRIGATREAVARSLGEWRELGVISTGRGVVVHDQGALRRLAAGGLPRASLAAPG